MIGSYSTAQSCQSFSWQWAVGRVETYWRPCRWIALGRVSGSQPHPHGRPRLARARRCRLLNYRVLVPIPPAVLFLLFPCNNTFCSIPFPIMASPALRNVASQCRKVSLSYSINYTPYSCDLCRNHSHNIFKHADNGSKIMCIGRNYMVPNVQTLNLLIQIRRVSIRTPLTDQRITSPSWATRSQQTLSSS